MSEIPELTLAQAFITYKFPFTLLVNYNPAGMPMPKGDMTGGGGGTMEDMCYERLRAEACVDYSAHHAPVNAGERDIV
jgi:hypothetical protein